MEKKTKNIKRMIIFFMITLFISGLTAMPAETELAFLSRCFSPGSGIGKWIEKVYTGVANTNRDYPFIAYGYDWLAFAHFVLALLFIGPLRHPVRNKWVIEFGMLVCLLIVPFAFVAGHFRGIPFWWRMIDCSFGIIGLIPLMICYRKILQLEKLTLQETAYEN